MEDNDYFYASTDWGDLLIAYNGNFIYYDDTTTSGGFKIGNPTTYYNGKHWDFTWEHGRQLATMFDGTATWTNTYNSDGLRTSRTDGTTTYTYIYETGRLSAIKRNDLNMWIIYDDHGPVTIRYGSGTFHYVTNPQGDVMAIVDANGSKLVEYTYDAWGKVTSITGDFAYNLGIHNPILYRGYVYDHETQLYYCQSRYYDPEIGRWLNADAFASTGQGFTGNNMFAYCNNNPVNYSDLSGAVPTYSLQGDNHTFSEHMLLGGGGKGGTGYYSIPTSRQASAAVIENEKKFINNTSERAVLDAEYFAFYKGTLVIRHSSEILTSWSLGGVIFLNRNSSNKITLAHEYGHILREQEYGTTRYFISVFFPSAMYNFASRFSPTLSDNYYNMPWEYDADINGNVMRNGGHAAWAPVVWYIYFSMWGGV